MSVTSSARYRVVIYYQGKEFPMATRYMQLKDAGLCPRCGGELDREGTFCTRCTEYLRPIRREAARKKRERDRKIVLDHYGGKCECCGETEPSFLAIDHRDGGGNEDRRRYASKWNQYARIIRDGFPDDLQILCHNCNWSKHVNNGVCAHSLRLA